MTAFRCKCARVLARYVATDGAMVELCPTCDRVHADELELWPLSLMEHGDALDALRAAVGRALSDVLDTYSDPDRFFHARELAEKRRKLEDTAERLERAIHHLERSAARELDRQHDLDDDERSPAP